jgi:ribose transport system substrate-binding protein
MIAIKRSIITALGAALLLGTTACQAPEHATDERYYLISNNIKVPYWQSALAGLGAARREMGVKAEMVGPDTYDVKAEHEEFQRVMQLKPTGILISAADAALMGPDIDAALGRGIPVLTIDADAPQSKRLYFIGTDNYKVGTMGGQLTAKLLNGKGNVVIFTMPEQGNLAQRLHGYQDVFADSPGIKVTQIVDIKGDPTVAFDTTKKLIDSKAKVDAFVCLEAIACAEVGEVVSRYNLQGKVAIVAMDTDQRVLNWIQKGVVNATISQKPYTMAYYGLKQLDDLHHHKLNSLTANWEQDPASPIPTFVDTGESLVDKTNVAPLLKPAQQ